MIDEIPLISVGLREVFRSVDPSIRIESTDSVYTALSAKAYDNKTFDLIILGWSRDSVPGSILREAAWLKEKFPGSRIMLYSDRYDHVLIDEARAASIDACVHKFEAAEEILAAYAALTEGTTWLSPIFDTLYNSYRLQRDETLPDETKK